MEESINVWTALVLVSVMSGCICTVIKNLAILPIPSGNNLFLCVTNHARHMSRSILAWSVFIIFSDTGILDTILMDSIPIVP